jgi:hypothetical protein
MCVPNRTQERHVTTYDVTKAHIFSEHSTFRSAVHKYMAQRVTFCENLTVIYQQWLWISRRLRHHDGHDDHNEAVQKRRRQIKSAFRPVHLTYDHKYFNSYKYNQPRL